MKQKKIKYKIPKNIILKNPKLKMYTDSEIQVSNVEVIGLGKVLEIDLSKSMLKRENVKKITLIIE